MAPPSRAAAGSAAGASSAGPADGLFDHRLGALLDDGLDRGHGSSTTTVLSSTSDDDLLRLRLG